MDFKALPNASQPDPALRWGDDMSVTSAELEPFGQPWLTAGDVAV